MATVSVQVDASGFVKQLQNFGKIVRKKVVRRACTDGGQEYVRIAKLKCPVRDTAAALQAAKVDIGGGSVVRRKEGSASFLRRNDKGRNVEIKYKGGLLRKAQGYKVKVYGSGIGVSIGGTRSGFRKQIGVYIRGKKSGQPIYADPRKYAHLVINGIRRGTAFASKASNFHELAKKGSARVVFISTRDLTEKAAQEASRS